MHDHDVRPRSAEPWRQLVVVGDAGSGKAAVAFMIGIVGKPGVATAAVRGAADEVDARVARDLQLIPQERAPAARTCGDGIAKRHDSYGCLRERMCSDTAG